MFSIPRITLFGLTGLALAATIGCQSTPSVETEPEMPPPAVTPVEPPRVATPEELFERAVEDANTAIRIGDTRTALRRLGQAANLAPNVWERSRLRNTSAELLLKSAREAISKGQLAEAKFLLGDAGANAVSEDLRARALRDRGFVCLKMGQGHEAHESWKQFILLDDSIQNEVASKPAIIFMKAFVSRSERTAL